ncbi:MAG: sigma-54-dependent Fis family transcriptional regulator [Candidatus Schekmanbacteria bacterium]|nr:MAG: sigma-54-dependent Fis family transcriptional regulator [Candidatus Schekmanbacteria bacterium]
MARRIAVIDDEELIRWSLQKQLSDKGFEVETFSSGEEAIDFFKKGERVELIITDFKMPGKNGLQTVEEIKKIYPNILAIMITAFGTVETAVTAMKQRSITDYILKPVNFDELLLSVEKAFEISELRRKYQKLIDEKTVPFEFDNIICKSSKMKSILDMVKVVSRSDATTITLIGESGTGKDLLARAIHYNSQRRENPFMDINCAALPDNLLESELFGHEKGAFTDAKTMKKGLFELADKGTIFLDEIGDMKQELQAKLLSVLEKKFFRRIGGVKDISVDVRIIAATNRNLRELIETKEFREDLYYRLNVINIEIPPLRERKEDIMPLVEYFVEDFNRAFKKNIKKIAPEVKEAFLNHSWPGNVREMKNVVERCIILAQGDEITMNELPPELNPSTKKVQKSDFKITLPPEGIDIEEVEKELILQAIKMTDGNQTAAAELLKISRDAFRRRLVKYNLI